MFFWLPVSGSTFPEWIRMKPNDTDPTGSGSEKQFLFVYLVQKQNLFNFINSIYCDGGLDFTFYFV